MLGAAFFQTPAVQRLLARAAACAGTPLSLHYVERNQEGPLIAAWGEPAAACGHVAALTHGTAACRQSRMSVSAMAARQQRGMAFVCHMGFACYAIPAIAGEGYILTFGPYALQDEADLLHADVAKGLEALVGRTVDPLPFPLDDVHRAPVTLVPAVAEWLIEALAALVPAEFQEASPRAEDTESQEVGWGRGTPRPRQHIRLDPFAARTVALSLAGGNQPEARAILRVVLESAEAPVRVRTAVQRARAAAAAAAVLEAAERAGLPTARAWLSLEELPRRLRAVADPAGILDALMQALAPLRRDAQPRIGEPFGYARLNAILQERMERRVPLSEVAHALGASPSALSKRLQRSFGMNYSEYLARLRIEKAKALLLETDLSNTEIACRIGIRDQSNFAKLFRKFEAMTPSAYRARHRRK